MAHTHTERHRGWQQLGPKLQDNNSSRRVQVKFKNYRTKIQEHTTTRQQHSVVLSCRGVSYGNAIFLDPLTATSLDHHHTSVQENSKHVQVTYQNVQDNPKNRTVKMSTTWTATRRHQHERQLQRSPMSPHVSNLNANDIKLVTSSNSWHQLHTMNMNITWRFQRFSPVKWNCKTS